MLQAGLAQIRVSILHIQDVSGSPGKAIQQRRLLLPGQAEGRRLPHIPAHAGQAGILIADAAQVGHVIGPLGPAAQIQQAVI